MSKKKHKNKGLLKDSELVSLLGIYYERTATINSLFATYITIFLSGIFVVLGACVIGVTSSLSIGTEMALVSAGCLLAILLAAGLKNMTKTNFEHALENVAKIAIVEEKLRLNDEKIYKSKNWKNDSLVMKKHAQSREGTGTVAKFIESNIETRQYKKVKFISNAIIALSIATIVVEVARLMYIIHG